MHPRVCVQMWSKSSQSFRRDDGTRRFSRYCRGGPWVLSCRALLQPWSPGHDQWPELDQCANGGAASDLGEALPILTLTGEPWPAGWTLQEPAGPPVAKIE